jgi:hypothetical protein
MQFLYRFRRTEQLLGKHKELEGQEIYFPSPDELNDPVEGFKDMFWLGDEIVWKNLIKHYLLCLESTCRTFLIDGENFLIAPANIPVFETASDLPTPAFEGLYQEICELFFKNALAARWSQALASRAGPIRQNELYAYLSSMHIYALNTIFTVYENHEFMPRRPDDDPFRRFEIRDLIGESVKWANSKEAERPDVEDGTERLHATTRHLSAQANLIAMYNAPTETIAQKNRRMLFGRFPEEYLKSLERLVHPPWYTATFTGNFNNPSIWGHYGDGHKGICLKFRASTTNGEPHLKLDGIDYQFYRIKYARKYPEINFFRSLGVPPFPAVIKAWYFDEHKNKSSCLDAYDDEDAWRKSYWDTFHEGITTRLEDWRYEDEYRLIHTPGKTVTEKSKRKLKYQFSDLEGIVFGIRTPEDDKSEIIRIIEEKYRSENRTDFKFYQAFYSRKDAHVDAAEMLLKFNQAK